MTSTDHEPVRVPTRDELRHLVVEGGATAEGASSGDRTAASSVKRERAAAPAPGEALTAAAEALLRRLAEPGGADVGLETHWRALGVTSGSVKATILGELRRHGFVRLERKGRMKAVHLFPAAWTHLGVKPPGLAGRGGAVHRRISEHVAGLLRRRGYDVHTEQEVGATRKRVDLVAYGPDYILGVEVGATDARQELKNLRDDLATGVLDAILFVSPDADLAEKVRRAAAADPGIAPRLARVHFYCLGEEGMS